MCDRRSDSLAIRSGAMKHGENLEGMVITAVVGASARYDLTDEWTAAYIELWTHLAAHLNFTLVYLIILLLQILVIYILHNFN
jgi:hypothetical protein